MARLARWLQLACFGVAISMLGYCAFVVVDTWMFRKKSDVNSRLCWLTGRSPLHRQPRTTG